MPIKNNANNPKKKLTVLHWVSNFELRSADRDIWANVGCAAADGGNVGNEFGASGGLGGGGLRWWLWWWCFDDEWPMIYWCKWVLNSKTFKKQDLQY